MATSTAKVVILDDLTEELFDSIDFIEKSCFDEYSAFPTAGIPDIVRASPIRYGAYVEGLLVGYALARVAFGVGYLYSNAVLPGWQRRGIGEDFLALRLAVLREAPFRCGVVQAHTRPDNEASAALLKKWGFTPVQYVTDFYDDNKDAILWQA